MRACCTSECEFVCHLGLLVRVRDGACAGPKPNEHKMLAEVKSRLQGFVPESLHASQGFFFFCAETDCPQKKKALPMMWKAPATGAVATSVIVEDRRQAERERGAQLSPVVKVPPRRRMR